MFNGPWCAFFSLHSYTHKIFIKFGYLCVYLLYIVYLCIFVYLYTLSSVYTSCLWIAALFVFIEMARQLGKMEDIEKFQETLDKAKASFDMKFWNGIQFSMDLLKLEIEFLDKHLAGI